MKQVNWDKANALGYIPCSRCSGMGFVAPWGTCFRCDGNLVDPVFGISKKGKIVSRRTLSTDLKASKKVAKEAAK